VDAAPAWEQEVASLNTWYARAIKAVRAGDTSISAETLTATQARIAELNSNLDAASAYRTTGTHDEVGYTSPTPVTDGQSVWVLFGNGVTASFSLDGRRRWARWLGPPVLSKGGYQGVDTASPVLSGTTLVLPYRNLTGVDAATGANRWRGPAWPHYGTPTLTTVSGRTWILTPDGLALDAASGAQLARGLGGLYYTSPIAEGDTAWYIGSNARYDEVAPNWITAWKLAATGPTQLYRVELPTRDRIYSVPIKIGDQIFTVTRQKQMLVLDSATGQTTASTVLSTEHGEAWAPLVSAGGRLWVSSVSGAVWAVNPAAPMSPPVRYAVSPNATTVWFQGASVYWRGENALYRFD
jgi:hypothetical protein